MTKNTDTVAVGFSYQRYSSPEQGDGDSIRRQTALARAWCERNNVRLDTVTTIEDRGRSAFRGKHRETGNLRAFHEDIEADRIPRGSVLLIENMDRLSREPPVPAVHAITGILLAGVRIVQLAPDELELTEDSDLFTLFRGQLSQARGHDESKVKSGRVGEAWGQRKLAARGENGTDKQPLSARCPAWLKVVGQRREGKHVRGGTYVVREDRAAVVRRIFDLAGNGRGLSLIVRALTEDKVPTWGRGKLWSKAYVHKIISKRAVRGEHQPLLRGKPDGDPIVGYYPQIIDEATWEAAQTALAARKDRPGRIGHKVAAVFSGLLWDAQTHTRMLIAWQTRGVKGKTRQRKRVLVSAKSMEQGKSVSFPAEIFEEAILSRLAEIDPADVLSEHPAGEAAALAVEEAGLKKRLQQLEDELAGDDDEIPALTRAAKRLNDRHQDVLRRLKVAQAKEANPQSVAWAETKTLLQVAKDEATRTRLRTLLRTIIKEVWVLVVPIRSHRLVVVQIHFAEGARRDYLIHYWSAGFCREGGWEPLSARLDGNDFDLRKRKDVRDLEQFLTGLDLGKASEK